MSHPRRSNPAKSGIKDALKSRLELGVHSEPKDPDGGWNFAKHNKNGGLAQRDGCRIDPKTILRYVTQVLAAFLALQFCRVRPFRIGSKGLNQFFRGLIHKALIVAVAGIGVLSQSGQAATLVVTNLADSGPGTLRARLIEAASDSTITFAVAGTIVVSNRLTITNSLSIIGPGADVLELCGRTNTGQNVFHILTNTTTSISGLRIRNGYAGFFKHGGAIYNEGNLAITNCIFTNCKAQSGGTLGGGGTAPQGGHGGAIYNSGNLTAVTCDFMNCLSGSGGIPNFEIPYGVGGGAGGFGGAIYSSGSLLAVNCNFLTNAASAGGHGASGGRVVNQIFPHGAPGGDGGHGGAVHATGPSIFIGCAFGFNNAGTGGAGGGAFSASSMFPGPGGFGAQGGRGGNGGAVFALGGVSFTSCTFASNNSGDGGAGGTGGAGYGNTGGKGGNGGDGGHGAVHSQGAAQFIACTLTVNRAGAGAVGGAGGAGRQTSPTSPGGNGGNGGKGGSGGAIYTETTNICTLRNVIVAAGNNVRSGGGGGAAGTGTPAIALVGTNGAAGTGMDLFGAFTSHGHNFIGIRTGNTGFTNGLLGDIVGTNFSFNPTILPLARNGGPTLTCAFLHNPAFTALNLGDDELLTDGLTGDARGFERKVGAHVDIGAYEIQETSSPIILNSSLTNGVFLLTLTNVPGLRPGSLSVRVGSIPGEDLGPAASMSEISPGLYQWADTTYTNYPERYFRVRWNWP